MRLLLAFCSGVMAVLLVGAAQLSPIDQQQNARLDTLEAVVFTPAPLPTFTATPTRTQTPSPTRTATASPTFAGVPLEPTQEIYVGTFPPTASDTPTLSATRTRTATPTMAATDLPTMTYATNISGVRLRIRECPSLTCEQLGWVAVNEVVTVDITRQQESGGFRFIALWNETGWVAFEQVNGARYLRWE